MSIDLIIATTIEKIYQKNKKLWRKSMLRVKTSILTLLGLSVLFSIIGFSTSFTFKEYVEKEKIVLYNLNILNSVGIALFVVTILNVYYYFKDWKIYSRNIDSYIQKIKDLKRRLTFDESGVYYSDNDYSVNIGWGRFSGYYSDDSLIILLIDNQITHSISFMKDEIPHETLIPLMKLIDFKLPKVKAL